jgi:hypothetical protein
MNRTALITLGVVVLVVACVGSFFSGMMYNKSRTEATNVPVAAAAAGPGQGTTPPGGQGGAGTGRGGMLAGQVESVADGVMTITDSNGKKTPVKVTDTTLIQKQASVPLSNLQTGESVLVSGSQNSDGSITARSVQVVNGAALEAMPTGDQNSSTQGGNMPPGNLGGFPPPGALGGGNPPSGTRP